MMWVSMALGAGILLGWGWFIGTFSILLLFAAGSAWMARRRSAWWMNAGLLFLLALLGVVRAEIDSRPPPESITRWMRETPSPVVLEGTLVGEPGLSRNGRMWSGWFRVPEGDLLLARWPAQAGGCEYGERLQLRGMVRKGRTPHPDPLPQGERARVRGSKFDERRWLWLEGAVGVLTVADSQGVVHLHQPAGFWTRYRRWVGRLRRALANSGRTLLETEEAGMLEGLLLGEGRGIRQETWDQFRKTGTVHVLVVSGSHVGLIGLISLTLLAVARTPRVPRYILLGGILLTYCLLCGLQPPIVRATIAGLLFCWARIKGIEVSPVNLLGAAAAGMLFCHPRALADASFQLSFAAVGGILAADQWIKNRLAQPALERPPAVRWVLQSLAVSCGASAATAPIIAWHFQAFTPIAPLANLIVVPWASLLIASGFVLCGAGWFAPAAGVPFAAAFTFLARALTGLNGWVANLPGIYWHWGL